MEQNLDMHIPEFYRLLKVSENGPGIDWSILYSDWPIYKLD